MVKAEKKGTGALGRRAAGPGEEEKAEVQPSISRGEDGGDEDDVDKSTQQHQTRHPFKPRSPPASSLPLVSPPPAVAASPVSSETTAELTRQPNLEPAPGAWRVSPGRPETLASASHDHLSGELSPEDAEAAAVATPAPGASLVEAEPVVSSVLVEATPIDGEIITEGKTAASKRGRHCALLFAAVAIVAIAVAIGVGVGVAAPRRSEAPPLSTNATVINSTNAPAKTCDDDVTAVSACFNETIPAADEQEVCAGCLLAEQRKALAAFTGALQGAPADCSSISDLVCAPLVNCTCATPCSTEVVTYFQCQLAAAFAQYDLDVVNCNITCAGGPAAPGTSPPASVAPSTRRSSRL